MEFPTKLMEAEVSVDIILSFNWLVEFNVDLQGRRYGLQTNTTPPYFIPGVKEIGAKIRGVENVRIVEAEGLKKERNKKGRGYDPRTWSNGNTRKHASKIS